MLALIPLAALAAEPAWYSGDAQEAAQVVRELDLQVELRPLDALLPTGSPSAVDALVLRCTGDPLPRYVLEERLAAGESALAYVDYQRAEAELRHADEALSCSSEPVDAALAARVQFLRGVAAVGRGDEPGARAWFERAHTLLPGAVWDRSFPAALGREIFEQAGADVAALEKVELLVLPEPRDIALTVDGRRIYEAGRSLELPPGRHHVHSQGRSFELDLGEAPRPVLIIPDGLQDIGAGWMEDEHSCRSLDLLLAGEGEPGDLVFIAEGSAWRRVEGRWTDLTGWEGETCRDLNPGAVQVVGFRLPQEGAPRALTLGGGVAVVGGVALAASGYAIALSATRDLETWQDYEDAVPRHAVGSTMLYTGEIVAGIGAVSLAGGLIADRVAVGPRGLRVEGRF
jgi:hypothetical protein